MPDGLRLDGVAKRMRGADDVDALYRLFLGRAAGSEEIRKADCDKPMLAVAEAIIASAEFRERVLDRCLENGGLPHDFLSSTELGQVARIAAEVGLTAFAPLNFASATDYALDLAHLHGIAFLRAAYRVLLARDLDPEGERHFLAQLDASEVSKQQIIAEIMGSDEFRESGRSWRMICRLRAADISFDPDDAAVLPFGWRSALYRVLASGPALRMLERHHGATARKFVAALQPAHPDLMLHIGAPGWSGGPEAIPVRDRLWIDGWALARRGVASVEIEAGEQRLNAVSCGLPHANAAAAFPEWPGVARSGFAAMIPARDLPPEVRVVRVVLRDKTGKTATAELFIERTEDDAEPAHPAPSEAETDFYRRLLANCEWQPCFCLVAAIAADDEQAIDGIRAGLAALRDQPYTDWRLVTFVRIGSASLAALRERLVDSFPEIADRIAVISGENSRPLAEIVRRYAGGQPPLVVPLAPGIEPTADALFELAAANALHPEAELFTSDETEDGARLICMATELLDRAEAKPGDVLDDEDCVERWAEQAGTTSHVPLSLCRQADQGLSEEAEQETDPAEQECLADCDELLKLYIDRPEIADNAAELPIRSRLFIEGWALARSGVASIDVELDGKHVSSAHYGLPRWDVAEAHPDWADAKKSGFMISMPGRSLPKGRHAVRIVLRDRDGNIKTVQFSIDVAENLEENSLRRKISQAEINLQDRILSSLDWHPKCCLLMSAGYGKDERARAQATLASLREQAYSDWQVYVALGRRGGKLDELRDRLLDGSENVRTLRAYFRNGANSPEAWRDDVLDGFDDIADRVTILHKGEVLSLTELGGGLRGPVLFGVLAAGDQLSADALMEFAVTSGMYRDADFLYSDELRVSPASKNVEPFLKPQWSPDLLLSTNYIGRLWCAKAELIERIGATLDDLFRLGEYDLVLRATEAAKAIRHVPRLLCRRGDERLDSEAMERRALERAIGRRGIAGEVLAGCVSGTYRMKRRLVTQGLVSIIIPTRASRGLIRTCIETLRNVTAYRNFEIICLDNIPADQQDWKHWLRANADKVIEIPEPFNWSRFNNRAAEEAAGEFLLFLNDDIEIIEPDWLDALVEHGQRPEVAIAGPMLLWPDRTVQSAGVFLTNEVGQERHAFRNIVAGDPGYFGLALTQRNVIAINGACFLTRREIFERLDGFDEAHCVVNNETDYCLKAWHEGLLLVFTPYSKIIHHERATRKNGREDYDASAFKERWGTLFADGDPYHHPHLSKELDCFTPEAEPLRPVRVSRPLMNRDTIRKILFVKLDHIGDCITAFPAMRRLKEVFSHASLWVLASHWTRPIWSLAEMIDEVVEFNFFHNRADEGMRDVTEEELQSLHQRLAPHHFDLAVDLRRHPETRHILQYTGARFLAGFDIRGQFPWLDIALEWGGDSARMRKRHHATDELINIADAIIAACESEGLAIIRPSSDPLPLSDLMQRQLFNRRVVCIHPAAGDMLKQWPPAYFAELIDLIVDREGVNIVLIGGPDDKQVAAQVLQSVRNYQAVLNLVGEIKLADLPNLLMRCALFVGNDSGPKHIAAGLGVPTIGIHSGHVDVREWGPVGPYAIALRRDMECSPCYLPSPKLCPRDLACLKGLRPGQVYPACRKLLATGFGNQRAHISLDRSVPNAMSNAVTPSLT